MAFANEHITAYAVEATEFPDLARKYRITGVPKTVVMLNKESTSPSMARASLVNVLPRGAEIAMSSSVW